LVVWNRKNVDTDYYTIIVILYVFVSRLIRYHHHVSDSDSHKMSHTTTRLHCSSNAENMQTKLRSCDGRRNRFSQ
jgi:hypothetical protein